MRRMSRRAGTIVLAAQLAAVHVAVPLELSRAGPRHGWRDRRPGRTNLSGLVPLAAGAALLGWAVAQHYAAAEEGWGVEPGYLLTDGPYRHSRNPMYVGGAAIWGGWAVLLGSAPVAAGLAVLTGIYRTGVAWEERMLERRWGDEWRVYAARTPRWL